MSREEARAFEPESPKELIVHEAAWPWLIDAIYERGLAVGRMPGTDTGLPAFIITTTEKPEPAWSDYPKEDYR